MTPADTPTDAMPAPLPVPSEPGAPTPMQGDSPEARMSRRFPQKIKVADLLMLPVIDDDRKVLGVVLKLVRTDAGKIQLIVNYSRWFGFFARPVAVPIEKVGILGRQVGSIDMEEKEYLAAPTWQGAGTVIPGSETIRIALAKR